MIESRKPFVGEAERRHQSGGNLEALQWSCAEIRAPDGSIGRSYSSKMCFVPTKDEKLLEKQRALRQTLQAKQDAWVKLLQKHADSDGSGFASTAEGHALRRRVEMGLIAAQLGITDVDELAKAAFEDRAGVVADIAAYSRLLAEAAKQGLEGLPGLPTGLAGTAG